jgi:ABC-type Fe3+/spermidine/putrescine transport system ATPase subunit
VTVGGVEIEAVALDFRFGAEPALDGLSLEVPAGRITAVVGPSGAGKSTLLRVVAGLLEPEAGDVRFDGVSVLGLRPEKRDLGVVFQSYALFPHMTVEDNVGFGLVVRGVSRREARRRGAEVLERLEMTPLARRLPEELSGGERQRVALARALAFDPRALLLDEPLAALDARLRLALRSELAENLRRAAVTALYVTHDQEEAMAVADRVAVVHRGRVEQAGPPEELYRRPRTPFVASFFGEANLLPGRWDPATRRFEGELGSWRLGADGASADGASGDVAAGPARLLLRPGAFRPASDAEPGADGVVHGRVVTATFLGGRRRLVVRAGGTELRVDLDPSVPVRPGESVALRADLGAAVVLPAAVE